ncbi:MAG: hypothetical protein ACRC8S_01865 [Fimbriiglobus sp.]
MSLLKMIGKKLPAVLAATAVGAMLTTTTGCQNTPASFGGLTLPSPNYLNHSPQYFPPTPNFPLQKELDSMQDPEGTMRRGGAAPAPITPVPSVATPTPAAAAPAPMPK